MSEAAFHLVPRRLSKAERIERIAKCIRCEIQPDLVALQDSNAAVASALVSPMTASSSSGTPSSNLSSSTMTERTAFASSYRQIASVRNGRIGFLQLFQRVPHRLGGRQEEKEKQLADDEHNGEWTVVHRPQFPFLTCDIFRHAPPSNSGATEGAAEGFRLTCWDLSHRGKGLGQPDSLNAAPLGPASGSNNSTMSLSSSSSSSKKRSGGVDPQRQLAIQFVQNVVQPDVLLGNCFMSSKEQLSGFWDAWVVGGSRLDSFLTTNMRPSEEEHRREQRAVTSGDEKVVEGHNETSSKDGRPTRPTATTQTRSNEGYLQLASPSTVAGRYQRTFLKKMHREGARGGKARPSGGNGRKLLYGGGLFRHCQFEIPTAAWGEDGIAPSDQLPTLIRFS